MQDLIMIEMYEQGGRLHGVRSEGPGTWARPVETGLRATWLGHSTVLLEIGGHRVLTDPV